MAPISGLPSPVSSPRTYKFQQLQVYQLTLDYVDAVYAVGHGLPESERFNLRSQLERAATSIVLNIAEGSTSQSDAEQHRFLGLALRSYIETVACLDLIERRGYLPPDNLRPVRELGYRLFVKLQAFRNRLVGQETEEEGGSPRSSVPRPRSKSKPIP